MEQEAPSSCSTKTTDKYNDSTHGESCCEANSTSVSTSSSASRSVVLNNGNNDTTTQQRTTAVRSVSAFFFRRVVPMTVLVAVVGYVIYYFVGDGSTTNVLSDLDLFRNEDPTNGQVHYWEQQQVNGGLELMIFNALDPVWQPYFETAVQQWDNGSPDSLTLITRIDPLSSSSPSGSATSSITDDLVVAIDNNNNNNNDGCSQMSGVLKVCNSNYGATDWKGVNMIYMHNDYIVSSVAIMNDYFFTATDNNNNDKRQYTMCHEIGHGLGLPHTDERFWNRDQGNCMDYTNRFSNNYQPDSTNFNTLVEMYGVVGGSGVVSNGTTTTAMGNVTNQQGQSTNNNGTPVSDSTPGESVMEPTEVPTKDDDTEVEEEEEQEDDEEKTRHLLRGMNMMISSSKTRYSDRFLQTALDKIDKEVVRGSTSLEEKRGEWQLMHSSYHGRSHRKEIGLGHVVVVHYLLATEDENHQW